MSFHLLPPTLHTLFCCYVVVRNRFLLLFLRFHFLSFHGLLFFRLFFLLLVLLFSVSVTVVVSVAVTTRFGMALLLHFSAANNNALILWLVARSHRLVFNSTNHIHSIDHLTKDHVLSIKVRAGNRRDEELRSVCIRTGIRHTQQTGLRVFVRKRLVCKPTSVDALTSCSVLGSLKPEKSTNLVKSPPWIIKSLMTLWNFEPL